jgi:hypothetical protein
MITKRYTLDEEAFWQKLVLPQEDRLRFGAEWKGGYRWFRSSNIVCLEHYRITETNSAPQQKAS